MNEHDVFDLLDEYALATLAPAEMVRVREHLATCAACRREYDELRNVLDVLPFALDEERPNVEARKRLLARLDAPPAAAPAGSAAGVVPRRPVWIGALAAVCALALAGDAWSAWQLSHHTPGPLALVSTTPAPLAPPSAVPERHTAPSVTPARTPTVVAAPRTPAPTPAPRAAGPASTADIALRARVARLAAALRNERRRESARIASDRRRIVALESALANQTAALVALRTAPVPSAQPSQAAPSELVAALSGGRVYGVDGVVGSEPWHLTIVQPPAGANALIFTDVPHAPSGETYRTWVVRGAKTFDAGVLPAGTQTKLVMPMPLEAGDVVAFSREPLDGGDQPTNPFLMQVKI